MECLYIETSQCLLQEHANLTKLTQKARSKHGKAQCTIPHTEGQTRESIAWEIRIVAAAGEAQ